MSEIKIKQFKYGIKGWIPKHEIFYAVWHKKNQKLWFRRGEILINFFNFSKKCI